MGCPSEVEIGDNLVFSVTTHDPDTGVLTDADAVPTYRIYEDETGADIDNGNMAKLDDANTTGFYTQLLVCTVGNGYENGKTYTVYIEATVDGDKGGISYGFKAYDNRKVNVQQWLGTAVATPTVAGIPEVDVTHVMGTILTEGAGGQLAGGMIKFFDKAAPTGTINSIPDVVAGVANGLFIAGTNAATVVTASFTTTFTGNLTGSVGSVTGAVGSVTGAVGSVAGNVDGSVASVVGAVGSVAGNVDGSTASVVGAVGSVAGAVGSVAGNVDGSVASVVGAVGSVAGNVDGSVASVVGAVGSVVGAGTPGGLVIIPKTPAVIKAATDTLIVAAADSTADDQAAADFVCDGTDDEAEINTAFGALPGGTGTVFLMAGIYNTAASILVPTDSALDGEGYGSAIRPVNAWGGALTVVGNLDAIGGNSNVTVRNILVDGALLTPAANQNGIALTLCSDSLVERCFIEQLGDVFSVSCIGIKLDGCTDTVVRNNEITAVVDGINTLSAATPCYRLTITGNKIKSTHRDYGINLFHCYDSVIANNEVRECWKDGIALNATAIRNVVTENIIERCGRAGGAVYAGIRFFTGGTSAVDYNEVSHNVVRDALTGVRQAYGIHVQTTGAPGKNQIHHNDLINAGDVADFLDTGTDTVASGNLDTAQQELMALTAGAVTDVAAGVGAFDVDSTGTPLTLAKAMEAITAVAAGKSSYNDVTGVVQYKGQDGATTIVQVTIASEGNRSVAAIS